MINRHKLIGSRFVGVNFFETLSIWNRIFERFCSTRLLIFFSFLRPIFCLLCFCFIPFFSTSLRSHHVDQREWVWRRWCLKSETIFIALRKVLVYGYISMNKEGLYFVIAQICAWLSMCIRETPKRVHTLSIELHFTWIRVQHSKVSHPGRVVRSEPLCNVST